MPIEFLCEHCQRLLKVGRRKIGGEVACPKCGMATFVPDEVTAGIAVALREANKDRRRDDFFSEFAVFDDPAPVSAQEYAVERSGPTAVEEAPPARPVRAPLPAKQPTNGHVARPRSLTLGAGTSPMVLISRDMLYLQAGLFFVVGLVALGAGYLIGRSHPAPADSLIQDQQIAIEGALTYKLATGEVRTDIGAAVLAIPAGKIPQPKWPASALHPREPAPAAEGFVISSIEDLGGCYGRVAEDGKYLIAVPRPGRYQFLFISRGARRPQGQDIQIDDLDELREYFDSPTSDVIGRNKYLWQSIEIAPHEGLLDLSRDFGMDGK